MIHSFDSDIAKEYGLVEAILLNYFQYWIAKNEANERNFYEGRYWTYNSVKAFNELFPYLSPKKIRTALDHLVESELLMTGNYNADRHNRTLWYAFTEKGKCIFPIGQMEVTEKANGIAPEGKCINTINYTVNNTIKENKNAYGEFNNVLLTSEEYAKVRDGSMLGTLEELSSYIASSGKRYKSHYATILNWHRRKQKENAEKNGKMKRKPSFDIDEIAKRAKMNDNYDID